MEQSEARVIFKLPVRLHRAAKIRAIMMGVTLEEALTRLVRDWVGDDVLRMLDAHDAPDNQGARDTPTTQEAQDHAD